MNTQHKQTGRQYINTDLLADRSFEKKEEEAEIELVLVATAELDGEQK